MSGHPDSTPVSPQSPDPPAGETPEPEALPASPSSAPAPPAASIPSPQKEGVRRFLGSEWAMVWLTAGILAATAVNVGVAISQWRAMKAQTESMKHANRLNEQALEHARSVAKSGDLFSAESLRLTRESLDTTRREKRAWVMVTAEELKHTRDGRLKVELAYQNIGSTPAVITAIFFDAPLEAYGNCPTAPPDSGVLAMSPGKELHTDFLVRGNPPLEEVNRGLKRIYVYGQIRYRDVFNQIRNTRICRIYKPPGPGVSGGGFGWCSRCNESD